MRLRPGAADLPGLRQLASDLPELRPEDPDNGSGEETFGVKIFDKCVPIWKRQPDGSCKLHLDIWNNYPPPR